MRNHLACYSFRCVVGSTADAPVRCSLCGDLSRRPVCEVRKSDDSRAVVLCETCVATARAALRRVPGRRPIDRRPTDPGYADPQWLARDPPASDAPPCDPGSLPTVRP